MGLIIHDRSRHWPNPVPYRIDESVTATLGAPAKLNDALAIWNSVSPLQLAHDADAQAADYITFRALSGGGGGSSSSIGRNGGEQLVSADFGASGSQMSNLLVHEIGHAVGLIHEHQRPDRDAFITSHRVPAWNTGKAGDIRIRHDGRAVGRYDCASLMHYLDIEVYLDPKPGQCTTLSNTAGLTDGDIAALGYLGGQRYRILRTGMWSLGWSHLVPFEDDHREYLLAYSRADGDVRFDRVDDGGASTTNWGGASWSAWDAVITFELGDERYLLVYERASGSVRIDRIIVNRAAMTIATENVGKGKWSTNWRSVVPLGLEGFQRSHVLVYDPDTGIVRIDSIGRDDGDPGFATRNVWERTWRAGYTTVMPFRLGDADWFVLAYHKGDGQGAVHHVTNAGAEKVQELAWDAGWTHFVPYAQHSAYSYHHRDSPEPSARFLAYRASDGLVHFDRAFRDRVEILGSDTWGPNWDTLVPIYRGEAGRFHLGNDGLIAYDAGSGQVHFDQLL